jgi:hypothetical protein
VRNNKLQEGKKHDQASYSAKADKGYPLPASSVKMMLIFGAEDGMRTRSADAVELLIGGDHANIKRLPKRPTRLGRMIYRPIAPLIALAARSKSEFRVSESVRFDSPMPFEL